MRIMQKPSRPHGAALAVGSTLAAGAIGAWWWFSDRAPYPYSRHRVLDLQLPVLTNSNLDCVLRPRPGEHMLEIGPGTGLQAIHIAPQLGEDGTLDIVDIQQEMLDHVMARSDLSGPAHIVPHRADAQDLPFDAGTFDAVYTMTALGEIPDPRRALTEAARVLKPGGRLVVGEFFDRHWIPFERLRRMALAEGLCPSDRLGPTVAYLASFRAGTGVSRRQ